MRRLPDGSVRWGWHWKRVAFTCYWLLFCTMFTVTMGVISPATFWYVFPSVPLLGVAACLLLDCQLTVTGTDIEVRRAWFWKRGMPIADVTAIKTWWFHGGYVLAYNYGLLRKWTVRREGILTFAKEGRKLVLAPAAFSKRQRRQIQECLRRVLHDSNIPDFVDFPSGEHTYLLRRGVSADRDEIVAR